MISRYFSYSSYLRARLGGPARRIGLDTGFSCPNRDGRLSREGCAFCEPAAFSPPGRALLTLPEQIRSGIEQGAAAGIRKFVAYFQPYTNTYAPLASLRSAYDSILGFPEIEMLAIGTRPDCVNAEILALVAEYSRDYEVWLEYGLQTIHPQSLAWLERGHTAGDFLRAVEQTRKHPALKICAHVILGIPGETPEDEAATAETLARLRIEGVKLHVLHAIQGTRLAARLVQGEFQPLTQEAYASRAADFLERLPADTVIQRLCADCPAEYLLAPKWMLDKPAVLQSIRRHLEQQNTWQGRKAQ